MTLQGVRVLDLSRVLAGPSCTQILGDLGADVIKVEAPGTGDVTRTWGPPFAEDGTSAYFLAANRNKRSLTLDLATREGRDIALKLAEQADVLVENFKVGTLARHGLDYASLATRFPRLVYCSITGFGQTGPRKDEPGFDFVIQGLAGLMGLTGVKAGVPIADLVSGLYATIGILAALRHRDATGRGQYIDLALFDAQVAALANEGSSYLVSGVVPVPRQNDHPTIVPYQTFATRDDSIVVAVGNDAQFRGLCAVLGDTSLATDARFATNPQRVRNREALVSLLGDALRRQPSAFWLERLARAHVPAGPVRTLDAVFADPQVAARDMTIEFDGQTLLGSPLKLSDSPVTYRRVPPKTGADTETILEALGYSTEYIHQLRERGVV